MAIDASQLHTPGLFFVLKRLFQDKVQCIGAMGGRSFRDVFNVLFDERHNFGAFQVWNQKVALHLHDLTLAERKEET